MCMVWKVKKIKVVLLLLVCGFLIACAGTTKYQDYPRELNGDSVAYFHFKRPASLFGIAVTAPVYVDSYLIGRLGSGGEITVKVPVGSVYTTSTTNGIEVNTKKGYHYYFELTLLGDPWMQELPVRIEIVNPENLK